MTDFQALKWSRSEDCQVCGRELPDGYAGFIGTAPGIHAVVVAWVDESGPRADGAVSKLFEGLVQRMTPAEAQEAASAARAALEAA